MPCRPLGPVQYPVGIVLAAGWVDGEGWERDWWLAVACGPLGLSLCSVWCSPANAQNYHENTGSLADSLSHWELCPNSSNCESFALAPPLSPSSLPSPLLSPFYPCAKRSIAVPSWSVFSVCSDLPISVLLRRTIDNCEFTDPASLPQSLMGLKSIISLYAAFHPMWPHHVRLVLLLASNPPVF